MWASGDYPRMVDTFLLPVGQRLADACPISAGDRVLDVAAGTGNASIPAAQHGARVTATDLTPALLEAGARRPEAQGLDLEWVPADAEDLPFDDGSFDVVMSCIGVMFAPFHQLAADQLVRVCRPGGTIGLLSWTPEGMIGGLFRTMKEFAPPPPAGAQSPPLWGSEEHLRGLFGGEHFKTLYGPTIAARANAERNGRAADFDAALDAFCDEWNLGTDAQAYFEQEYLVAVGTRV